MRIVVLGAGVIGVTTAWSLLERGHSVTLVDRQPGPAQETSFANAGEISPGYASPWAGPGIPRKAIGWLMMKHAPLAIRPVADPAMIRWLLALLGNCTSRAYARNKERMVRLAEFSRDCLDELRTQTGIAYDERMQGTLQLFRTQQQLDGIGKDIAVLQEHGIPFEVLDAAGCIAAEPGLAHAAERPAGGLRLPGDETGDCYKFTSALFEHALAAGLEARMGESVLRFVKDGERIATIVTDKGEIRADAVVVALGSFTPALVAPLGLSLPVYPIKGYSITVPIVDESRAPVSTILDESYKIATTRLGDRIRVAGMAEVSGFSTDLPERRKNTLLHSLGTLFPGAADASEPHFWSGLRPMTPDGTPVVGKTQWPNLFLNTGHGTLGWTMACGSARLLADVIEGRVPPITYDDFGISRYRR